MRDEMMRVQQFYTMMQRDALVLYGFGGVCLRKLVLINTSTFMRPSAELGPPSAVDASDPPPPPLP